MTEEQFDQADSSGASPPGEPGPDLSPSGVSWGLLVTAIGLSLVVIFAVQNTSDVPVKFLWMESTFPLSIVILVTAVAAMVFSGGFGSLYRRRKRRIRAEREELKRLRDGN